jgi:hypothetical protein
MVGESSATILRRWSATGGMICGNITIYIVRKYHIEVGAAAAVVLPQEITDERGPSAS